MKEFGTLDSATQAQQIKNTLGIIRKFSFSSDDTASISGVSSISRMESINENIRHMNINVEKSRVTNHNTKLRNDQIDKSNTITSQMDTTNNLTLKDSIHVPKDDPRLKLSLYHAGVMCSAYSGTEEELEEIIKSSLVNNNINYIKIGRIFYNGNNFVVVTVSSENDRNKLLELSNDKFPKFINYSKLDKTSGKRRMRLANIPVKTSTEKVITAIKKQIGDVISIKLEKHGDNLTATCVVDVRITDKEFNELWSIKYQDFEITKENDESNSHNNHGSNYTCNNNNRNKITCKYWRQGICKRNDCKFVHYNVNNSELDNIQENPRNH